MEEALHYILREVPMIQIIRGHMIDITGIIIIALALFLFSFSSSIKDTFVIPPSL